MPSRGSYTLYTPAGSFRAFPALIAAEYNGIDVQVAPDFGPEKVKQLSPTGKAPVLVFGEEQSVIFSSHAIARYLAGLRRDTGLTGRTLIEQAEVDAWMDFAQTELELPVCVWLYPVSIYILI